MSQFTLDAEKFPLHDAAVKSALSQYAKHVQEIPLGSNTGPDVSKYQHATFLGGTGWPWCVAFYQWNWLHIKHPLPYRGAGAYDLLNWAIRAGWRTYHPIPGDGVCWNIGAGHWSMFLRTEGSYIVTIDGNVSDRVLICKRPVSLVRGYMHVPELAQKRVAPVSKKLSKPRLYEIVTAADGHTKVIIHARTLSKLLKFIPLVAKNHPLGFTVRPAKGK